jgi:hypothetical protein
MRQVSRGATYLVPNRNSLQKPIGGRSLLASFQVRNGGDPKRGRSVLAFTAAISMLKHQKITD